MRKTCIDDILFYLWFASFRCFIYLDHNKLTAFGDKYASLSKVADSPKLKGVRAVI
jgi:hypothetical protein